MLAISQLESARILESNQKSMAALIASLSPATASASSRPARSVQVKPPKWTDEETPHEYFSKYEKAMLHNGVEKSAWGQLLPVYLAGRAQPALAQVEVDGLDDYESVKATLLESLGDTPESADRKWWSLGRLPGEEPGSFYLRVRSVGLRRLYGLSSKEEITEKVILSRFLSLLPADCYSAVVNKHPKTGLAASRLVQEYEETRTYVRKKQPWKQDNYHHYKREQRVASPVSPPARENSASESGNASGFVGSSPRGNRTDKPGRKPIKCHGCGEPGHIRPNCPHKVRRVTSPEPGKSMSVKGWLAGREWNNLRIDTGADRTVVRSDCVPSDAYTSEVVRLDSWRGAQFSEHRVAQISIRVDDVEELAKVAVVDQLDCPALLGKDLGPRMTVKLLSLVLERAKAEQAKCEHPVVTMQPVESEVVRATRAQVKKARKEEEENDLASALSESEPVPLSGIFDFEEELFSDDVFEKGLSDPDLVPTPLKELEGLVEDGAADIPLPKLGEADRNSLSSEQKADPTLKAQYLLAEKQEKGYSFDKDILVHTTCDELGDSLVRILVPKGRRLKVLEVAHTHMLAGHFGRKKTFTRLSSKFLWPRMWIEVKEFVRGCSGCQRAGRKDKARAPLQPLQCESEPFSKVAFDLVGPLPRSTSGYRYVLTMMDLYSKFPAAIPLKKVDNLTVIEAMMEVFSCYGLPKVLLTDQGSVFTSRLTKEMCKQFEIEKIQTSPYHPQSDGALERWHACLKGMLKRSGKDVKEWDRHLKYLLFAYRSTPHCTTGFSPFLLMFGREARGPLDILQESWLEGDSEKSSVFEWLTSVKAQMKELSVLVSEREQLAKVRMKNQYDKSSSPKEFVSGDMVLVWKPGIHAKMGASWDGPFQIEKKVSPVNYKVQVPGNSNRSKVLHVNMLKKWTTAASKIHRVAIVHEDEEGDENCPVGLKLGRADFAPSKQQQVALDRVLAEYPDVLNPEPGRTDLVSLCINTADHTPVSSHPYRIAPRWREEVKKQLDQLLELGIIQPSVSPWSSSIVTIKKKDGGVRICIDYRAVNAITQPDPYQMPLIDDILEALACAKFISKVDLNKGFHQIPVDPSHYQKTAFCTPWGKYEFRVMPFGVRNGPSVFQRLMDQVLNRDSDSAVVYIDDIAIFSSSWEQHCQDIRKILGRLRGAGLTANTKKCLWGQTHCEFLGHLVGGGMVSPAALKVEAVRQFTQPKTKTQVRQFLGLTGYYRRFVEDYAQHSFNLTETTKKSAPEKVAWTNALESEFTYLKNMLCVVPSLTLPTVDDEFLLQTDASGVGLGAVLSVIRHQEEYPVAFYSRKLQPRERKYSASELEGLAVVTSILKFDAYLLTHSFILETDHRALLFLNSANQCNGRLARWAMKLQPFSFTIRYRPGKQHVNADTLSRFFQEEEENSLHRSSTSEGGGDVMRLPQQEHPISPNIGSMLPDT